MNRLPNFGSVVTPDTSDQRNQNGFTFRLLNTPLQKGLQAATELVLGRQTSWWTLLTFSR